MTVPAIPRAALGALGLLVAGALLMPAAAAAQPARAGALPAIDPFYSSRLREGVAAHERGDHTEAVASLRVACFGMLDVPAELAQCLVRLAVAQAAAKDREGFAQTFRRLVEGEEILGLYSQAALPPALRAEFEKHAAEWIPPASRELLERQAGAAAPPASPSPAAAPGAVPPSSPPAAPAAAVPAPPSAAADRPAPGASAPPRRLPAADEQALRRISEQLAAARSPADVESAYAAAVRLAATHPGVPRVEHVAAEAAYRASRWQDAVEHFRRGGDPGDAQPLLLFYFAVSLWESGEREPAAALMRRCDGKLRPTPFVESYRSRILAVVPAG